MSRISRFVVLAGLIVLFTAAPSMGAFFSSGDNDNDPIKMDSHTVVDLADKLKPAVVNIDTETTVSVGGFDSRNMPKDFRDFFERFFGDQMPDNQPKQRQQATGSGFLISEDGYIVTNNHVVDNAEKITVRTLDKKVYTAKVVGQDPKTDVALIKVDVEGMPFAKLGDSDQLKVGEWVLAIGNPFGLDHTVTAGIVSAKGRVIGAGPYDDFIQTDAAINFGNSGGPLFDFHGRVVGMNTAIIARGQGIGFAVPVNVIKDIVSQLKDKGKVTRAELGVMIQPVTDELAESFGLKNKAGAIVSQVLEGSPAEKAGIRQGDVIVSFNDVEVQDFHDLPKIVNIQPVGSKAKVGIIRDGKSMTLTVKLGEQKDRSAKAKEIDEEKSTDTPKLGLKIQDITPEIAEGLGISKKEGVVVTGVNPDSPALAAGIKKGDVVLEINRTAVENTSQFAQLVKKADQDKPLLLLVQRGQNTLYIPLKWKVD